MQTAVGKPGEGRRPGENGDNHEQLRQWQSVEIRLPASPLPRARRKRPRDRRTANDGQEGAKFMDACPSSPEILFDNNEPILLDCGPIGRAPNSRPSPDVRFESKADIEACLSDVRFVPNSGHGSNR